MSSLDWLVPRGAKGALLMTLAAFALFYLVLIVRVLLRSRGNGVSGTGDSELGPGAPTPAGLGVGAVTNFFDTLGIGSFATTTSIFRFLRMVPDERIPGTLNVGHTLPAIAQAFIYTRVVPVEATTLVSMIGAAVIGAWLGAGVVCRWPRRTIQLGMGLCLIGAATLMLMGQVGLIPAGGTLLGVSGAKLAIATGGNFVLGALMTLGIGLYAPCLILVSMLGMNPTSGFPIMMGSCAFLMPIASARFVRERSFRLGPALGLMLGGIPAVLVAAFIVRSLPLSAVRWLVIVVVVYTAVMMIRAARREGATKPATAPAAP